LRGWLIVGSNGRLRSCFDRLARHSSRLLSRIFRSGSCNWLLSFQRVDHGLDSSFVDVLIGVESLTIGAFCGVDLPASSTGTETKFMGVNMFRQTGNRRVYHFKIAFYTSQTYRVKGSSCSMGEFEH
jgi:hypothetical protein